MTREMTENTKQRILEAAAHEFASKGFDGARVDEIARSAGVNKALIYYYYKNKEELLTILFLETRDAVVALMKSGIMQNIDYTKPDEITRMISAFLDVLEERQDVIRVMLMETAKRAPINKLVFDILADIIALMFSIAEDQHVPVDSNKSRAMITEFFTGIMPVLDYVAYHEIWMEQFSMEESALRAQFVESFLGSHFGYTIPGFPHGHCSNT